MSKRYPAFGACRRLSPLEPEPKREEIEEALADERERNAPRLLDLFCGGGGAAMGYHRAGFDVVGVDHLPQPNYPFEFIEEDAMFALAQFIEHGHAWPQVKNVAAIHASPPCQAYSALGALGHRERHPRLIKPLRRRLVEAGMPYVIENVEGAPLERSVVLCGSMYGLGVRRHRIFECNFPVMGPPCSHLSMKNAYEIYEKGRWFKGVARVYGTGGGKAKEHWAEAMDIDWMTTDELREAIPPAYTEHIGYYLMLEVQRRARGAT